MERTKINKLEENKDKKVLIKGWLHEIRDQSGITFLLIRDNSGIVQTVIKKNNPFFKDISSTPKESVLSITGLVKDAHVTNPEVTQKTVELQIESFSVLSLADKNLPIQVVKGKDDAELSTKLDNRWIDLRKPRNILIFQIWTYMEQAMREWWSKNDFIQIYSPKLMGAPSESGAELFSVEYFGKKAYLAQSPQFYKQMAMAAGFEKIFEIGPVFRANPSHTAKHDTEFTMLDMEISYIDSHEDVMKAEEEWLHHVIKRVKEKYDKDIKEVFGVEVEVPALPFPRITMNEAVHFLKEKGLESEGELDAEGELAIYEIIKEKCNHDFVFITEYPISARPFYHMRKENDNTLTKSFDLLWKGLEITTGAQREHRPDILKKQAIEKGLNLGPIEDYLNFFKYGCPPHGGFGLSPTRMLMILLGIQNVREVTFLPRDTERLRP